jgi:hypothetical protein
VENLVRISSSENFGMLLLIYSLKKYKRSARKANRPSHIDYSGRKLRKKDERRIQLRRSIPFRYFFLPKKFTDYRRNPA